MTWRFADSRSNIDAINHFTQFLRLKDGIEYYCVLQPTQAVDLIVEFVAGFTAPVFRQK